MPDKEGSDDEKKSTKSVVNKKQKLGEEGYDIARDMGKVSSSKDKKDATTMPVSDEVKKTQKKSKGKSAVELVKAKYGKSVMNVGKKKANEELDLSKVAEAFGGYIVEVQIPKNVEGQYTKPMKKNVKRGEDLLKKLTQDDPEADSLRFKASQDKNALDQISRDEFDKTIKEPLKKREVTFGQGKEQKRAPRKGVDYFFDPKRAKADRERTVAKRKEYEIDPKTNQPSDAGVEKFARKSLSRKQQASGSNVPIELSQSDLDTARKKMVGTGEKGTDVGKYGGRMSKQMSPKNLEKLTTKLKTQGFIGDKEPKKPEAPQDSKVTTGNQIQGPLPAQKTQPKPSKISMVAQAARKNPAAALAAYDLGKGIIGKIMKTRMPAVQGGRAIQVSAGK